MSDDEGIGKRAAFDLTWSFMFRASRYLLCLQALFWACTLPLQSEELQNNKDFQLARQALREGLPAVAAVKASRLLNSKHWEKEDRQTLTALSVESWVRAKDGPAALALMQDGAAAIPNGPFWKAQAQVLAGELDAARQSLEDRFLAEKATWQEQMLLAQVWMATQQSSQARVLLTSLRKSAPPSLARQARVMLDELDIDSGNAQAALEDLNHLPQLLEDPVARLIRARGLLTLGRYLRAEKAFRNILSVTDGGERVHHNAAVFLAESLLRQDKTAECLEALVQFLDNTPESDLWTAAFELLHQALSNESAATTPPNATLRWIVEGNTTQRQAIQTRPSVQLFQGHAMLLLARWLLDQNRTMEGIGLLEAMIQVHADHPQGAEAMRLALETYGSLKADARVSTLASQWRQRYGGGQSAMVDFVTGGTAFTRREYIQAASLFQAAANIALTLSERRSSLYNAGVAALRAGETALYQSILSQLEIVSAAPPATVTAKDSAADLELDAALDKAARADATASMDLRSFIQKHSAHPRVAEAWPWPKRCSLRFRRTLPPLKPPCAPPPPCPTYPKNSASRWPPYACGFWINRGNSRLWLPQEVNFSALGQRPSRHPASG
jgi:hypothetical protein